MNDLSSIYAPVPAFLLLQMYIFVEFSEFIPLYMRCMYWKSGRLRDLRSHYVEQLPTAIVDGNKEGLVISIGFSKFVKK